MLHYYEQHKLQGDRESDGYKQALFYLQKIVDDLEESYNLDELGVREVLNPYLSSEEDRSDVASLDEFYWSQYRSTDASTKLVCGNGLEATTNHFSSPTAHALEEHSYDIVDPMERFLLGNVDLSFE